MDKWIAGKIGDMVEDKVKSALGVKDEEKGAKKGGFISKVFHKDEKKKEKPPAEKEGFFSKIFDHDGDKKKDKPVEKKSGFAGLFSEREDAGDAIGYDEGAEGAAGGIEGIGEGGGQSDTFNDEELLNDLMDVASNGN